MSFHHNVFNCAPNLYRARTPMTENKLLELEKIAKNHALLSEAESELDSSQLDDNSKSGGQPLI